MAEAKPMPETIKMRAITIGKPTLPAGLSLGGCSSMAIL